MSVAVAVPAVLRQGGGGAVRQGGRGAVAHRQWSTEGRLEQVLTGPEALSVGVAKGMAGVHQNIQTNHHIVRSKPEHLKNEYPVQ